MKKTILLVICLVWSSFVLTGCSTDSEPFEEKIYTPDTQIRELILEVRDREIEVSLSEDGQIHIQYSENSKEYYDISVSDENVLVMASASDKEWTYWGKTLCRRTENIVAATGRTFRKSYALHNKRGHYTPHFERDRKYQPFF